MKLHNRGIKVFFIDIDKIKKMMLNETKNLQDNQLFCKFLIIYKRIYNIKIYENLLGIFLKQCYNNNVYKTLIIKIQFSSTNFDRINLGGKNYESK